MSSKRPHFLCMVGSIGLTTGKTIAYSHMTDEQLQGAAEPLLAADRHIGLPLVRRGLNPKILRTKVLWKGAAQIALDLLGKAGDPDLALVRSYADATYALFVLNKRGVNLDKFRTLLAGEECVAD